MPVHANLSCFVREFVYCVENQLFICSLAACQCESAVLIVWYLESRSEKGYTNNRLFLKYLMQYRTHMVGVNHYINSPLLSLCVILNCLPWAISCWLHWTPVYKKLERGLTSLRICLNSMTSYSNLDFEHLTSINRGYCNISDISITPQAQGPVS